MSTDPFSEEKHEKMPSLSFTVKDQMGQTQIKPVGTRLGGRVVKAPEIAHQREYVPGGGVGKLQYWHPTDKPTRKITDAQTNGVDNQPVRVIVTVLETAEGQRSLWTPFYPKNQFEAIQKAIAEAGAEKIEVGGELYVTVEGGEPNAGKFPTILYSAEYKAPNAFSGDAGPTATAAATNGAAPPPPASAPSPPPAPVAPEIKTQEGYTHASLTAAGWTHEQIVAQYPVLGAPAAPSVPPAPPAPPAPPSGDDARAAALAALSPEDRALLGL